MQLKPLSILNKRFKDNSTKRAICSSVLHALKHALLTNAAERLAWPIKEVDQMTLGNVKEPSKKSLL